jgi:hypothetical membrane protein
MDVYWLEAWLVEISHGLHARGLLGAITHLISKDSPNVLVLNAIALAISVGITAVLAVLLYRNSTTVWSRLATGVLLLSPLCGLFYEEVGDPLMVVFALFLLTLAIIRCTTSRPVQIAVCAIFCLAALYIHEASVFLFVPAIALLNFAPQRVSIAALLKCALLAAPLLILVLLDHAPRLSNPDYQAVNPLTHEAIPRIEVPFPSYIQLAHEEADIYFGSKLKTVGFFLKFPRVWCIQLLGLVLVAGSIARGPAARRLWRNWIYLSICSAPLYVIAVDWGRFTTITFWLSVLIMWLHAEDEPAPLPNAFHRIFPERMPTQDVLFGSIAALILGANALYPDYGINGMPAISLPIVVPAVIAWGLWRTWSRASAS